MNNAPHVDTTFYLEEIDVTFTVKVYSRLSGKEAWLEFFVKLPKSTWPKKGETLTILRRLVPGIRVDVKEVAHRLAEHSVRVGAFEETVHTVLDQNRRLSQNNEQLDHLFGAPEGRVTRLKLCQHC